MGRTWRAHLQPQHHRRWPAWASASTTARRLRLGLRMNAPARRCTSPSSTPRPPTTATPPTPTTPARAASRPRRHRRPAPHHRRQPADQGVPTGAFGAEFNDRGHAFIDTQSYLAVDYTRALDAATELSGRAYLSDYTYWPRPSGHAVGTQPRRSPRQLVRRRFEAGKQPSARNKPRRRHRAPAQPHPEPAQLRCGPYRLNADDHRQSERSGVFVQDDFQWTPDLKLSVGGRVDQVTGQGAQFSPPAGRGVSAVGPDRLEAPVRHRLPGAQRVREQLQLAGSAIANPAPARRKRSPPGKPASSTTSTARPACSAPPTSIASPA